MSVSLKSPPQVRSGSTPPGNSGGALRATFLWRQESGINPMQAMAGGIRMGDYMVASSGLLPILSPDGRLLVFQTTFFPGAASPVQASVVSLTSGEERTDVNFQLTAR